MLHLIAMAQSRTTPMSPAKITLRVLLAFALLLATFFGLAGRLDLPYVWACLGLYAVAIPLVALNIDPGLLKERMRPGPGGEDRHLRRNAMLFILPHWILGALDLGRLHWTDTVLPAWRS